MNCASGKGAESPGPLAPEIGEELLARVLKCLGERQRERPWLMGLTAIALAQSTSIAEPELIRVLARFVETGALTYRSGYYATPDFIPELRADQRLFFERAFSVPAGTPVAPLLFEALRTRIRTNPDSISDLAQAFETLVAAGALSKVGDFVYTGAHIASIRTQLERALHRQDHLTVAEFRTLTGTSRKYAVPLLEFFDATGVTLRHGNLRVLRRTTTE